MLTHAGQSVWENGLGQNIFYFAQLLRTLPFVASVVLLNCGDQTCLAPGVEALAPGLALVPPREAADLVDVVFEMGGGLDVEWLDYVRARGTKVVFFCCGQPYVGLVEPSVFRRGGYFSRARRCDEVWVLPKDRTLMPMLGALHRCPVHEVPFLWDSAFIAQRAAEVAAAGFAFGHTPQARSAAAADRDSHRSASGRTPARMPGSPPSGSPAPRALRVAIFEPNISVVKCCVIPMLLCDVAFREEPRAIARMHVLNSVQMQDQPTFAFLLRSLDLHRRERVTPGQRHDFAGYMSQYADTVVAHQWHNEQNILHLDALYGGYPLVHNSPWLAALGYYYEGSDIAQGAAQLLHVARHHDGHHDDYVRRAHAFLATLSPQAPHNRTAYARSLLQLGARAQIPARRPSC
nr:DUF2827 family protein [Paraburkholderia kururiensis]